MKKSLIRRLLSENKLIETKLFLNKLNLSEISVLRREFKKLIE